MILRMMAAALLASGCVPTRTGGYACETDADCTAGAVCNPTTNRCVNAGGDTNAGDSRNPISCTCELGACVIVAVDDDGVCPAGTPPNEDNDCAVCGDDLVTGLEVCEGGVPLPTCAERGWQSGAVSCAPGCAELDETACVPAPFSATPMLIDAADISNWRERLSPDGVWIAYRHDTGSTTTPLFLSHAGDTPVQIDTDASFEFAPDSSFLLVDSDGSGLLVQTLVVPLPALTHLANNVNMFKITPDSEWIIALATPDGFGGTLHAFRPDGTDISVAQNVTNFRVSPTGATVAYQLASDSLEVASAPMWQPQRLSDAMTSDPTFQQDGSGLLFIDEQFEEYGDGPLVHHTIGGATTTVAPLAVDLYIQTAPSGDGRFAYDDTDGITWLDSVGGERRQLGTAAWVVSWLDDGVIFLDNYDWGVGDLFVLLHTDANPRLLQAGAHDWALVALANGNLLSLMDRRDYGDYFIGTLAHANHLTGCLTPLADNVISDFYYSAVSEMLFYRRLVSGRTEAYVTATVGARLRTPTLLEVSIYAEDPTWRSPLRVSPNASRFLYGLHNGDQVDVMLGSIDTAPKRIATTTAYWGYLYHSERYAPLVTEYDSSQDYGRVSIVDLATGQTSIVADANADPRWFDADNGAMLMDVEASETERQLWYVNFP